VLTLSFSFSHQDIFSLSFSLVEENLLSFSCSFSHVFVLVTFTSSHVLLSVPSSTQSYSTQYALLSAKQHVHFRSKLWLADKK